MKIKTVVKVELTQEERDLLTERVKQFTDGGLCEGMDCRGIHCTPDCPLYNLDEEAQKLRKKVLDFIEGAN